MPAKAFIPLVTLIMAMVLTSCSATTPIKAGNTSEDKPTSQAISPVVSSSPQSADVPVVSSPSLAGSSAPTDSIDHRALGRVINDAKDITVNDLPSSICDIFDNEAGHPWLLSALPENNIYLYGYDDPDDYSPHVILRFGDTLYFYDWIYMTPRRIFPELHYADFDKDGEKELAIILYVGSGTGCAIEDLRIIKMDAEGHPVDYYFPPDDYKNYLKANLSYTIDAKKNLTMITRHSSLGCGPAMDDWGKLIGFGAFGDIVSFTVNNNKIVCKVTIGFNYDKLAVVAFCGRAVMEVSYKNGVFGLGDITLETNDS